MTEYPQSYLGLQAIQNYSRWARRVVWAVVVLMTTVWIMLYVYPALRAWFGNSGAGTTRFLWNNLLFSLPVFCLRMAAIYRLEKLFRLYQKGQVFHLSSIRHIRLGAKLFLWSVAVEMVIRLSIAGTFILRGSSPSVIVTFIQPFFGVGIAFLIVGLLMLLVSRIMEQASRLSEEVELTV